MKDFIFLSFICLQQAIRQWICIKQLKSPTTLNMWAKWITLQTGIRFTTFFPLRNPFLLQKTSTHTHLHTLQPPTHALTISEGLKEHLFTVGSVAGHSAGPHLDHIACARPQALKDNVGCITLDHWAVQQRWLELQRRQINNSVHDRLYC